MARGFVFELEPLLEHRRRIEEEHQRAVAALERVRLDIEERIRTAQETITEAREVLRDQLAGAAANASPSAAGPAGPGRVALDAVRLQMNASFHMTSLARKAVLELAGAHKRLEAARARLLEATKARRALEILKERRFERWKREQRRREEREMDEINTQRARRADATDLETPR